jgi:asparagine synthase (glutamine-hydrolysing)
MQLQADVPVGVFLSGGLDSSLITYYISKLAKLKSFSISFDVPGYDESEHARAVAKRLGTKHYAETFKPSDVISIFSEVSSKLDEPFADAAFLPTYKVSKLARKHVKVALSGDGADELFGGYPTYQAHLFSKYLNFLPNAIIEYFLMILEIMPESLIDMFPTSFKDYPKKELASILLRGVKKDLFSRHMFLMRTFFLGSNSVFKEPDLASVRKLIPDLSKIDYKKRAQVIDFHTYLPDDFFFKVDRASMYNSLEVRVPYMDNDIIDFAFSTRLRHVDMFKTKKIFRKLVEEKIPEIAKRPKRGFGVPLSKWFKKELKDFAWENLNNKKLHQLSSKSEIEKVWKEYQNGRESNAGTIWMLIVLSGWLDNWM